MQLKMKTSKASHLYYLYVLSFPRRKKFPTKRKLLTEEEYLQQANEETRKALEELRNYCRSPDCNAWKTISRLDSPSRQVHYSTKCWY